MSVTETIPFGSTQAGADWVYPLPLGQAVVYTSLGPPSKSIQLQGTQITVAKGATVNISGGGDLQAVEFVPGVGGTIDVLSTAVNPQEFAILPQSGLAFAPYDWQISAGFPYAVGTTVTLGAGSGVPAGTDAVLPPHYALLNGGYLVTPVSGYTDLPAGQAVAQPVATRWSRASSERWESVSRNRALQASTCWRAAASSSSGSIR